MEAGKRARGRVATLIDEARTYLPASALPELESIAIALADPLRVAVVGRVNAGKSTLVNALLGQRVAPTAGTECTKLVTHYRYAPGQFRATAVLHDGREQDLGVLHRNRLPERLPAGLEEGAIARLEVGLPSAALEHRVVIDTPGLATVTSELDEATRDAILGRRATDRSSASSPAADVLIFVFRDVDRADELGFIRQFIAATSGGASAINAIGVLSHADAHGAGVAGDEDPVEVARRTAQRIAGDYRGALHSVVPIAGLLAETVQCGRLTEDDRRSLAALVDANATLLAHWQPEDGVALLGERAAELEPHQVDRLQELLAPYGVEVARRIADRGLIAVSTDLLERSGLAALETELHEHFQLRADVLKASHALAALKRLGHDSGEGQGERLLEDVEDLELDVDLHVLRELKALEHLAQDDLRDEAVYAALERLVAARSPHEMLGTGPECVAIDGGDLARRRATEALTWANRASHPTVAFAARVASRSFQLLARWIDDDSGNIHPA